MNKLLDELKYGDLIWANRYKTLKEKNSIPKNHEIGPFLVIKKTPKRVFALPCSTSIKDGWQSFRPVLNGDYIFSEKSLYKDTCIYLDKEVVSINQNNYKSYIGEISPSDMNNINKNLYVYLKDNNKKHINRKSLSFYYSKGDIISFKNKMYYIDRRNDNSLTVYLVINCIRAKDSFIVNGNRYKILFNQSFNIPLCGDYELINTCNKESMDVIKLFKLTYNKNKSGKDIRNCITVNNNKIYYIHKIDKHIHAIRLYTIKPEKIDTAAVYIDDNIYYSDMISLTLPLNQKMMIVQKINNKQVPNVIKSFKGAVGWLEKTQVLICKKIMPQVIIRNIYNDSKYIVLARRGNIIIIASYDGVKIKVNLKNKHDIYDYYDKMDYLEFVNFRLQINGYLKF